MITAVQNYNARFFVTTGDGTCYVIRLDNQNFTGMKAPKKVGDVIVLPITSFSPGIKTMNAGDEDDPMAFVKHNFEGMFRIPPHPIIHLTNLIRYLET